MEKNDNQKAYWRVKQKELTLSLTKFYQQPVAKVSLELALSVGLIIILIVVAIQPTLVTMTRLTKEINERKEINEQLPKKIAALNTAQAEYLQVEDKLPLLDEAIPEKINIVKYLKIIEYEATNNNVIINGLSVNQPEGENSSKSVGKHSKQKTLNMNVSVDGSYKDIKNFIRALESSRSVFLVNSVSFGIKKVHSKDHLIANISLSIPYYQ